MRIGIVINTSWNIHNFRQGLLKALLADGHRVLAIAPDEEYRAEIEDLGCAFRQIKMQNKGSNPIKDVGIYFQLRKIYREEKLHVVLHFTIKPNIYGSVAARSLGIPAINNVTGLGTVFLHNTPTTLTARVLYWLTFRFPKVIFFQNQDDRESFLERRLASRKTTSLLPGSGINLMQFRPQVAKPQNQPFTFLMIGRVLFDKGIKEYIEAIRILKAKGLNAQFQLLGAIEEDAGLGVTEAHVRQWEREGLISYLGLVRDVRPMIAEADCVVLPSYREGTPRTLIEAAAMGKPIVATDVPGCRETVVDGENGYLCQVKSAEDLAEKMGWIAASTPDALLEMGLKSRELAECKFDEHIVIAQYRLALDFVQMTNPTMTAERYLQRSAPAKPVCQEMHEKILA